MPKYIALLRGINVGGHNVKNEQLRSIFEEIGFGNVTTFIASGNVIFESGKTDATRLETLIEKQIESTLGYEAATFLRTDREIARIASHAPFDGRVHNLEGATVHVMFTREEPGEAQKARLSALCCESDQFHVDGREVYWLCQTRMSDSPATVPFGKVVGSANTLRNMNTVRRIADKFCVTK